MGYIETDAKDEDVQFDWCGGRIVATRQVATMGQSTSIAGTSNQAYVERSLSSDP